MKAQTPDLIIDASDAVLGRLASYVAKQALLGKTIVLLNCDKIKVIGNRQNIINEARLTAYRGGSSLKGPFLPKHHTDRMFKRTIRGMLSYKQQRGEDAFKRIRCYTQIPVEYLAAKKITFTKPLRSRAITLKEVSKKL